MYTTTEQSGTLESLKKISRLEAAKYTKDASVPHGTNARESEKLKT